MKTVKISLNSIDKVKAFVNEVTKFDAEFDLVSGRYVIDANPSWVFSALICQSQSLWKSTTMIVKNFYKA